jgi:hypothetical protein
MLVASNADLVVFLGPCEHVVRFALTVHCGIKTFSRVFRATYQARLAKMRGLVYPMFRDGGWDAETELKGMTSAQFAFGPLDTDEERLRLFPNKIHGQEYVERMGEEMYGKNRDRFTMNVTTLEDAVVDPFFAYELQK